MLAQSVYIRFWGFLIELVRRPLQQGALRYRFNEHPTVKDTIEACGVPHTEVDLIVVAGHCVDFDYQLRDGDCIAVYPHAYPVSLPQPRHLCPQPQEPLRFILDIHLGKLARRLRMLGFDSRYRNDYADDQIIRLGVEEGRVILTCDRGILKQRRVEQGLLLRSRRTREQLTEVFQRYRLFGYSSAASRCPLCNGELQAVAREAVADRLLPQTAANYQRFFQCCDCGKVYWEGAHFDRIRGWMRDFALK